MCCSCSLMREAQGEDLSSGSPWICICQPIWTMVFREGSKHPSLYLKWSEKIGFGIALFEGTAFLSNLIRQMAAWIEKEGGQQHLKVKLEVTLKFWEVVSSAFIHRKSIEEATCLCFISRKASRQSLRCQTTLIGIFSPFDIYLMYNCYHWKQLFCGFISPQVQRFFSKSISKSTILK